ncbi:hypothetical protein TNCV_1766011 [Trichonephila clavipes]|nr:hypothetical protein TNCV_1766011 [Trichonephila clavipes]
MQLGHCQFVASEKSTDLDWGQTRNPKRSGRVENETGPTPRVRPWASAQLAHALRRPRWVFRDTRARIPDIKAGPAIAILPPRTKMENAAPLFKAKNYN